MRGAGNRPLRRGFLLPVDRKSDPRGRKLTPQTVTRPPSPTPQTVTQHLMTKSRLFRTKSRLLGTESPVRRTGSVSFQSGARPLHYRKRWVESWKAEEEVLIQRHFRPSRAKMPALLERPKLSSAMARALHRHVMMERERKRQGERGGAVRGVAMETGAESPWQRGLWGLRGLRGLWGLRRSGDVAMALRAMGPMGDWGESGDVSMATRPMGPMRPMGAGAKCGCRHGNSAYGAYGEMAKWVCISMATGPRACYGGSGPMGPIRPMGPMGDAAKWGVLPWQRGIWGLCGGEQCGERHHGNGAYGAYRAYGG